ncbi:MAG: GtrA family protein [Lachnospira sp.]|nr:GtrA family protein [Lachnospira sp.]
MKKSLIQFIKFGLVGVSNTIVSYVIYALVYTPTDNYVLANIVGWAISVLNAYVWQNLFVFKEEEGKEKRVWWKVLLKTYMAYAFTGLILSNVLLWLWLDVIGIGAYLNGVVTWLGEFGIEVTAEKFAGYIAPFLNMAVTIPTNFLVNKFWAYRQK